MVRNRKRWNASGMTALAAVMVLGVSACSPAETPTESAPSADQGVAEEQVEAAPKVVNVVLESFRSDVAYPPESNRASVFFYAPLFDWLTGVDADGLPSTETGLASAWTRDETATVWTFTLREGATWHDGVPVTAADVAFTIETYRQETSTCSLCGSVQSGVESVEVSGDTEVTVRLTRANVNFAELMGPLNDLPILPKHYIESVGADGFKSQPLGSGPFVFESRTIGQDWVFSANQDYWNAARIPEFDTLRFVVAPEDSARIGLLTTGEADIALLSPFQAAEIGQIDGLQILGPKSVVQTYLLFGSSYKEDYVTNNIEMRRAIAHALDVDAIIEALYPGGIATRATGFGDSVLRPGRIEGLAPYDYDPELSRQILEEAGLAGETVDIWAFTLSGIPEARELLQIVTGYLFEVGLTVNYRPVEYSTVRPQVASGTLGPPGFVQSGFAVVGDPLESILRISMISHEAGGISAGFHSPDLLQPLFESYGSELDPARRDEIAREINQLMHDTYGIVPIATVDAVWGATSRVQGWTPANNTPYVLNWDSIKVAD